MLSSSIMFLSHNLADAFEGRRVVGPRATIHDGCEHAKLVEGHAGVRAHKFDQLHVNICMIGQKAEDVRVPPRGCEGYNELVNHILGGRLLSASLQAINVGVIDLTGV